MNGSFIRTLCRSSKHRLLIINASNNYCKKFLKEIKSSHLYIVRRVASFGNCEERKEPCKIPENFNFASDVLDKWAQKEKDGTRSTSISAFWFVSDDGKEMKLSFQDLQRQTKRVANMLESKCGVKRGDNVIVMLPKIPEFWLVNVAALRIGFILSPATMMLTVKDLAYRLSALKPSCIVAHETVADIVDEAARSCSTLKDKIIVSTSHSRRAEWHDFNRFKLESDEHQCAVTRSDETMMIMFTSGTTGNPKMVEHTHASYGIGLSNVGKYWLDVTSRNIIWNMSDTGWAKTLYSSFFGPWSQGSCVFVHQMSRFDPTQTLEVLSKYPIDTLCAPPLVYRAFVQENLSSYKFHKLEHCVSAGESLNVEVAKKWMVATGLKIYEGYGQTENVGILYMMKTDEYKVGSIGKVPPGVTAKIVDDNEKEVGPGVIGEIVAVRDETFGLFKRYKNDPVETKDKLTERFFHSGDLGYYDEDGYFWYVGRKDDLINSAGYRIGPLEVENVLMEHPAVSEVAVVSSPDEKRGEVVKAFISLSKDTEPSEELIKELQEHCKSVTAPYKYPRKIEFVKDLPKTISGKIKRKELKQKEWKKL